MRGMLGVRMVGRSGQTSGVILVTDKEQGDFTEEDESLLRQLATIASLALQHVEARIALEESDRSKNHFLAILSHELRNPLAPIRNSVYILDRATPGGDQARRAQGVIERQVTQLTRLVDDLLDVTRVARGKIQLRCERLDLREVVRRAVEDQRVGFTRQAVEVELAVLARPVWVLADRTRVAQIVGNLLENAAKFTEPGGRATVSVEENAAMAHAIVRVRDTGAGIAPEILPRIFEPFMQGDATLDRSKGGLGLGLALVKGLTEMHGGTVSVESEGVGRGATFAVRLPSVDAASASDELQPAAGRVPPRRILVVEDNADSAQTLREVLELAGHTVEVALSGTEGVDKGRSFRPEVVLCDIGLPGMNGYDVARVFRADAELRGAKLVALSGYAAPDDLAKSRSAGFDAHVAKPATVEALARVLA
jgi:signal transduction histidine kinase